MESKLITFGMSGYASGGPEYYPWEVTKTEIAQRILLQIATRPVTIPEIASYTGLKDTAVQTEVDKLRRAGLVLNVQAGFVASFPIWTAEVKERIEPLARAKATRKAAVIRDHMEELKRSVEATSLPSKGWNWDRLRWIVVFGILADTGVVDRGFRRHEIKPEAPERPGGGRYWFSGMEGEPPYRWSFGHNLESSEQGGIAWCYERRQTGHLRPKRTPLNFGDQGLRVMHVAYEMDYSTREEIADNSGVPASVAAEVLESGVMCGCVLRDDEHFRAHYPLFEAKEIEDIAGLCDSISDVIIKDVYVPYFLQVKQIRLEYYAENPALNDHNFIIGQFLVREFALEQLIDEGVLSLPRSEPPLEFWGWKGPWKYI